MALGVMVAGLAGYVGFLAFVAADRAVAAGTMFLAAATGFAAFFSPCSFPLLLTFLSRRAAESRRAGAASALAVGTGAAALLALIALVIGLGGEAIAGVVTFDSGSGRAFRLTVGLLLVMVGLRQTRKLPFRMSWLDRVAGTARRLFDRSRFSNRVVGDVVYGFGYLLAGFGLHRALAGRSGRPIADHRSSPSRMGSRYRSCGVYCSARSRRRDSDQHQRRSNEVSENGRSGRAIVGRVCSRGGRSLVRATRSASLADNWQLTVQTLVVLASNGKMDETSALEHVEASVAGGANSEHVVVGREVVEESSSG